MRKLAYGFGRLDKLLHICGAIVKAMNFQTIHKQCCMCCYKQHNIAIGWTIAG